MKEWTIEEIEKWLQDNVCFHKADEIIRSLVEQLKEKEREVARECVNIAEKYGNDLRNGDKQRYGAEMVAMKIREKYGVASE